MLEVSSKHKFSHTNLSSTSFITVKKQSKFHVIYNQALRQVQRKLGTQQQNLPQLKLKCYQQQVYDYLKPKDHLPPSQRQLQSDLVSLHQPKSIIPINIRYDSSQKKKSVNKILWQKKMSLQTLRISSSKNKLQRTGFFKQLQRQSLKHLRQKTIQQKFYKYDEEYNVLTHMSILPLNLISSREEKEKFLTNKKKIQEKFKMTLGNQKDKKSDNKIRLGTRDFRNKIWEIERDDDQFVNFVKEKTSVNYHS